MRNGKIYLILLITLQFVFSSDHSKKKFDLGDFPPLHDQETAKPSETRPEKKVEVEKPALKDKPQEFDYEKLSDEILADEEGDHKVYDVAGNVVLNYKSTITKDKASNLKQNTPYRFNHKEHKWSWWTWDGNKFVAMTAERMKIEEFPAKDLGFAGVKEGEKFKGKDILNRAFPPNPPPMYFVFGPIKDDEFKAAYEKDPSMGGQIPEGAASDINIPAKKTINKGSSHFYTTPTNMPSGCST